MAVNKKYVEKVGEEVNYDDVLKEFGASADFVEDKSGVTVPPDYWERNLKTLPVDEIFAGKPHLGVPEKIEWTDKDTGEKNVSYQVKLIVMDDITKEAYVLPLNLNSDELIHKDLYPASKLYALAMGLMELKAPGISRAYNRLTVDLTKLHDQLEDMESLYFKVIMIDNGSFKPYKSFRIVDENEI